MKKLIIPIGALLITNSLYSQTSPSTTENYIYTKTYLDYNSGNQPTKFAETVQYYDGLGRPKQVVDVKASPQGKDIVTHIEYDAFGRQVKDFLPVPQSNTQNGAIVSNPLSNATQPGIYGQEKIFSEKVLENSPLDRIQQQIQVGNDWTGKPVIFDYDANTLADQVKKFSVTSTWLNNATSSTTIWSSNGFLANQLYKNTVTDENGNKTVEFKNGEGQTILIRKITGSSINADTYYIYNEYNQLAFVVPPKAVDEFFNVYGAGADDPIPDYILNDLCYQYRYDNNNRLVEKKLPGKGWEYMVYDKADRLILTRDSIMKGQGRWLMTKYDKLGRPVYTGIITGGERSVVQNLIKDLVIVESLNTGGFTKSGMTAYYTNDFFTSDLQTLLSVNYYDALPQGAPAFSGQVLGQDVLPSPNSGASINTKGLSTASYIKNIEDDNWTKNYSWYDNKGRVIRIHSINHLGGSTITESKLDFAGLILKKDTYHKRLDNEAGIILRERLEYDLQNRLTKHWHQVDSNPEELLAENTYNELSQLSNKKVGNNLQSIDYNYNIRGWLTDVNKDQMAIPDLGGKLFSYKIKYTQREGIENASTTLFPGKNVKPQYNGNIAETDWRSVESLGASPSLTPKRYGYVYDFMNRLTAGYYQNPVNPYSREHTESVDYDLNGNITKLYRTSKLGGGTTATVIDDLQYNYGPSGNRLLSVSDATQNPAGYEGGGNTIGYDLNGNMTDMFDKGIDKIEYNHLNLPNRQQFSRIGQESVLLQTKYGADGVKLRKENTTTTTGVIGYTTVKYINDYLDGFQYLRKENVTPGGGGGEESRLSAGLAMEQEAYSLDKVLPPVIEPGIDPPIKGGVFTIKTPELQFFPTAEGFYDYQKDQYIYQYRDHLGNVRISFGKSSDGSLEITDNNDYYPFGMNHLKSGIAFYGNGSYKNYKYNAKELQETGMYDYGARMYMADLGRWGVIDPMAESSRRWSTYTYAFNNPMRFIDPDGMENKDIHILGSLADQGFKQLQANSKLVMTKGEDGKLSTEKLTKEEISKLSDTDKVLYEGITNSNIDSKIYAEDNNITPDGGLIPGGSFGGATYDASTKTSTGTQYTNPRVLGKAEAFSETKTGTGMTHEVVENVLLAKESLRTKSDIPMKSGASQNPVFDKFHDKTRAMMKYDNLLINARKDVEVNGVTPRWYWEGYAGKIDAEGKVKRLPLYKIYTDDKRLRK